MQRKVLRGRQQNYTILLLYQNRDSLEKSAVIMCNNEIEENRYIESYHTLGKIAIETIQHTSEEIISCSKDYLSVGRK